MRRAMTAVMALVLFVGCGRPDATRETVAEALAIADEYVVGYYDQFPEDAYETGYPAPLDRMGDRIAPTNRKGKPELISGYRRDTDWHPVVEAGSSDECAHVEALARR